MTPIGHRITLMTAMQAGMTTPTPFDHVPAGNWARIDATNAHDGDLLALRMPQAPAAGGSPDCWIWRLSPADVVRPRHGDVPATITVYGLGPAFVVSPDPAPNEPNAAHWELWKFYPAPAPSFFAPDELAERRAERSPTTPRSAATPRAKARAKQPYRTPVYGRRPEQPLYDQDDPS